jgi:hypothetical protein
MMESLMCRCDHRLAMHGIGDTCIHRGCKCEEFSPVGGWSGDIYAQQTRRGARSTLSGAEEGRKSRAKDPGRSPARTK